MANCDSTELPDDAFTPPDGGGSGTGDVVGPAASTDEALVRYDGITGKLIQNSGVTLDDSNELFGATIDVLNNTINNAHSLEMPAIGTPQYSSMGGIQSTTHSAGLVAGGAISNNGDGTIAVASGDGLIRASDSNLVTLYSCEWAADASTVLVDNSINYVFLSFVSLIADPIVATAVTKPTDLNTNILIGAVYREGDELHISTAGSYVITDHITKIINRFQDTEYFQHGSGAQISEVGTRSIANTAGLFYEGLNKILTIAQDTSGAAPGGDTFEAFYRDGIGGWTTHEESVTAAVFAGVGLNDATSGGTFIGSHTQNVTVTIDSVGATDTFKWKYFDNDGVTVIETTGVAITGLAQTLIDGVTVTFAAITGHTLNDAWTFSGRLSTQIDNTQYDDGSGILATLTVNRYGVHWIYLDVHGHIASLFGVDNYGLADAQDAQPPTSLPPEFETHARLIGKVIIQKSAAVFETIENNYGELFQGSVAVEHNANEIKWSGGTQSEIADGASNIAFDFDTDAAYTLGKLAAWSNNAVEKVYIDNDGSVRASTGTISFYVSSTKNTRITRSGDTLGVSGNAGTEVQLGHSNLGTTNTHLSELGLNFPRSSGGATSVVRIGAVSASALAKILQVNGQSFSDGGTAQTNNIKGGNLEIEAGSPAPSATNADGGDVIITGGTGSGTGSNGLVLMTNLPTADPVVTGALWNDAGTLKISP